MLQLEKAPASSLNKAHTELKKTNIKGPLLKKSMIDIDNGVKKQSLARRSDMDSYVDIISKKQIGANSKVKASQNPKKQSKSLVKRRSNDVNRLNFDKELAVCGNSAYPGILTAAAVFEAEKNSLTESRNVSTNGWHQQYNHY